MPVNENAEVITSERIHQDLLKLGAQAGDKLLVTSSFKAIGRMENGAETLLEGLMAAVGSRGAVFGLAFTPSFPLPLSAEAQRQVYTRNTPPITGAFNAYLVSLPEAVRSEHPISSFVGYGADASEILRDCGAGVMGYEPVHRLAQEPRSFMLAMGTMYLGVTTVHVAQNLLKLKTRPGKKYGVNYRAADGSVKLYTRDFVGGCSLGFMKFYERYRQEGVLREGLVGNAPTGLTNLRQSLKIDLEILSADPTFFFCDSPDCFQCRAGWEFSQTNWLGFQFVKLRRRLGRH